MNELTAYEQKEIELLSKYAQDDDFDKGDLSYGWLAIAQVNSPKAMKSDPTYIQGLEPGMFYNSITGDIYGSEVNVVYQKYFHSFQLVTNESKPKFIRNITEEEFEAGKVEGNIMFLRKGEGGFKGKSAWYLGDDIVKETWNYMVALPDHPEAGVLRLGLGAGAVKHVKTWNTMIQNTYLAPGKKAPKFAFVWKLKLSLEKKADGSYFTIGSGGNTTVEKVGPVPSGFLPQAIAGYEFFQGIGAEAVVAAEKAEADEDNPL